METQTAALGNGNIHRRHPFLLDAAKSALVVVDMQEAFLNVMANRDALTANVLLLVQAAAILQIPILLTTQYAQRMGEVIEPIHRAAHNVPVFDKMVFSCMGSEKFHTALLETKRTQILLCGIETHICISQTAHDLLYGGFQTHVAPDAVTARTAEKHKLGMERIRDAQIRPVCAEAAVYEWLYQAGTTEFKAILPLVK